MATLEDRVASLGANQKDTLPTSKPKARAFAEGPPMVDSPDASSTSPAKPRPSSPYLSESDREDEEEEEGASEEDQPLSDAELTQRVLRDASPHFLPSRVWSTLDEPSTLCSRARRAVRRNSCALVQIITILP